MRRQNCNGYKKLVTTFCHKIDKNKKSDKIIRRSGLERNNSFLSDGTVWTIKITVTTLCSSFLVSFLTYLVSNKSNFIISVLALFLLICVAIAFDSIGVAVTSCDLSPLLVAAAKKVKGASIAVILVRNAEKVSNICNDVIGDIAGIISGACSAAIVLKIAVVDGFNLFNTLISAVVSAFTVGGKAFFKTTAIQYSKEMVLFVGKIIGIIYHPRRKNEN